MSNTTTPLDRDRLDHENASRGAAEEAALARKLRGLRDRQMAEAVRIAAVHLDGDGEIAIPAAEWSTFRQHLGAASEFDRLADLSKKAAADNKREATVLSGIAEPTVYSETGSHSYYLDLARSVVQPAHYGTTEALDVQAAKERIARYNTELQTEVRRGGKDARRILNGVREFYRGANHGPTENRRVVEERMLEVRAGSSSSIAGFTTPAWLQQYAAIYRAPGAHFASLANNVPLPDYGVEVDFGAFTSAPTTGYQSPGNAGENVGMFENDPTGLVETLTVQTFNGLVSISQQLSDRGTPVQGGSFDKLVARQIQSQLDASVSLYVINQALATASVVTEGTTWTTTLVWADTSKAAEKLADTAGTRFPGTHCFSTSDLLRWISRQVDTQGRPIIIPDASAIEMVKADPMVGDGVGDDVGYTGILMPGGLRYHTDDSIPPVTGQPTQAQFIVAQMAEVFVFKGAPITFAYPETNATTLSVVVGVRQYVASAPRYPKAVAVVNGSGLSNLS